MEFWRNIINIAIAIVCLLIVVALMTLLWINRYDPVVTELVLGQFQAIIGLPFAFIAAFVVVALFRQQSGEIEFEVVGIKFKGSSGEIVLWLICFLSICAAIALLWNG